MEIYLIRHADAADAEEDAVRRLSARGRAQVRKMAAFLRRSGAFRPAVLWHSPLVRARETAELLARHIPLEIPLKRIANLEPEAAPEAVARQLQIVRKSVAIVGHEPHLSSLATLLVAPDAGEPAFVMKKGSVLALERTGSRWVVRWHVSPGMLG